MAELTVAINKFWRKLGNGQRVNKSASECIQNLVEEIADVQVMLEQVKYLLSIRADEVSDIVEQKLDRQIERIKNEQKGASLRPGQGYTGLLEKNGKERSL